MFGFRYLKAPPTTYVMQFNGGKLVREGAGLSFFYFAPTTELALIPLAGADVPFVFNEVTSDFQDATIQGEITYRIRDPKTIAAVLDFSVDANRRYRGEDPSKPADRLIHALQISARAFTQRHTLRELLVESDRLVAECLAGLKESEVAKMLGLEVLGLSILSLKATPEMTKALQAEAREALLRKADEAIYARRNSAVLLERTIKENELNTEIAVEQKQRTVRETKMAAEIAVEEQRAVLVDHKVANERKEADAKAYALKAMLEPLKDSDWKTLLAAGGGGDARLNIALAFRELAENATKIGELNISPELLAGLTKKEGKG